MLATRFTRLEQLVSHKIRKGCLSDLRVPEFLIEAERKKKTAYKGMQYISFVTNGHVNDA